MASLKDLINRIKVDRTPVDTAPVDSVPNGVQGMGLKDLSTKLLGTVKTHPWKSAGAGILGGINTAGLFDNSQMGGQLIGGLGGAAIPLAINALAKTNISPYWTAMSSMGGGALGSLFDKLIAKKKEEEAMMQQYQGQY